jgi:Uma2 family endonuclease
MNVQLPVHMDKPAFLAWVQGREERYELVEGRVVMMVGASRGHGLIVANLVVLLRNQINAGQWTVIADFGVDAGPRTLRYPDIMIEPAGANLADYTTAEPVLLAEVLSPTTAEVDLGDKAAEYLKLPSLCAYLVFAQREPKAYVWQRGAGDFHSAPTAVAGRDASIRIEQLNLAVALDAVYAGIKFD